MSLRKTNPQSAFSFQSLFIQTEGIRNRFNNCGGFTLAQVVIVLILMGILSVVAFPLVMDTLQSMRIRTAAEVLVSDIQSARNLASTKHDSIWVVFNIENDEYSLYKGSSVDTRTLLRHPLTGLDWVISYEDPKYKGVDITNAIFGQSSELLFDQWGDATTGGMVDLSNTVRVQVTELTGKTQILEYSSFAPPPPPPAPPPP